MVSEVVISHLVGVDTGILIAIIIKLIIDFFNK